MEIKKLLSSAILLFFVFGLITSCDTTSSNTEQSKGNVKLQFKTVTSSPGKAFPSGNTIMNHDSVTIEGSNGTLKINDLRFIVAKFKLEFEDDGCEEGNGCEEFESEPFLVDLPLDGDTLSLADEQIETGLYKKLEFEVKDLDFENDEEGEDEAHQALADSIRSEFPDWPDEASVIITGSFTPSDGDLQPFKIFAKAEIEIEHEFEPPLEVTDDNMRKVVSVHINPSRWLLQDDGNVFDLSQYDWDEQQKLLEFSAKFKDGVEEIKVDEEEFDD